MSPPFPMTNGTWQGCPLFRLLFIRCVQLLAEAMHSHSDIHGVSMRQREYKLSLFANDSLLTLTSPLLSLTPLHALLASFCAISGYKVNATRIEPLPLHLLPTLLAQLEQAYAYRWCPASLKYLGVNLIPSYSTLYSANYPPIVSRHFPLSPPVD